MASTAVKGSIIVYWCMAPARTSQESPLLRFRVCPSKWTGAVPEMTYPQSRTLWWFALSAFLLVRQSTDTSIRASRNEISLTHLSLGRRATSTFLIVVSVIVASVLVRRGRTGPGLRTAIAWPEAIFQAGRSAGFAGFHMAHLLFAVFSNSASVCPRSALGGSGRIVSFVGLGSSTAHLPAKRQQIDRSRFMRPSSETINHLIGNLCYSHRFPILRQLAGFDL